MDKIPAIVLQEAYKEGFNSVGYAGMLDGVQMYSVGIIDSDGIAVPMGLPTFILFDGNATSMVSGREGFDLMFRIEE